MLGTESWQSHAPLWRRIAAIVLSVFVVIAFSLVVPQALQKSSAQITGAIPTDATITDSGTLDPGRTCGDGSVAVLLDTSQSIDSSEMASLKDAAKSLVRSLSGPTSDIGVITFDVNAPATEVATNNINLRKQGLEGAAELVSAIEKLQPYPSPRGGARPGTNIAAAITAAKNQGYQSIILITDGVPTAQPADLNTGSIVNYSDVEQAFLAAKAARESGIPIYAVGVGAVTPENGAKLSDGLNVRTPIYNASSTLDRVGKEANFKRYTSMIDGAPYWLPGVEQGFTYDGSSLQSRVTLALQPDPTTGTYRPRLTSALSLLFDWAVRNEYNLASPPAIGNANAYYTNVLYGVDFLKGISTKFYPVDSYGALSGELAERFPACDGLVQVEKRLENAEPGDSPEGFRFTADKAINPATNTSVADLSQLTAGSPAIASFRVDTSPTAGASIKLTETQKDGFSIKLPEVAECTAKTVNADGTFVDKKVTTSDEAGTIKLTPKAEAGNSGSFTLSGIQTNDRVYCVVVNIRSQLSVDKSGVGDVSVTGDKFNAVYKVEATSPANAVSDMKLKRLVENPPVLPGTEIAGVQLRNVVEGQSASGDLVANSAGVVDLVNNGSGYVLSDPADLAAVPAGQSRFTYVVVTYTVTNVEAVQSYATVNGTCVDGESGKGIVNQLGFSATDAGDLGSTTACVNLTPAQVKPLQIVKSAKEQSPVPGVPNTSPQVAYTIAVTNPGVLPATVAAMQENPSAPSGTSIKSVEIRPAASLGDKQVQLLKSADPVTLDSGNSYEISADKFVTLPANTTGVFDVVVTYQVDNADNTSDWECSDNGGGLRNEIRQGDNTSSACVPLKTAGITVWKAAWVEYSQVRVSYTIRNVGEIPVTSVELHDWVLETTDTGEEVRSAVEIPQTNLTCGGSPAGIENNSVVTFNQPLTTNQSIECEFSFSTDALETNYSRYLVHDVLGDEVGATPSFEGGATGAEATSRAHVKLPSKVSVNKQALRGASVVAVQPGDTEVVVAYQIGIQNERDYEQALTDGLVEKPKGNWSSITMTNMNLYDFHPLLGGGSLTINRSEAVDGMVTVPSSRLRPMPAKSQSFIEVRVTYPLDNLDLNDPNVQQSLQCSRDGGLWNEVDVINFGGSSACVSVQVAKLKVEKLIDGQAAPEQATAVPILPAATSARVDYKITNPGQAILYDVTISDRYIYGARQDERFDTLSKMECGVTDANGQDVNSTLDKSSGKVTIENGLRPNWTLTCGMDVTLDQLFATGEKLHGNTVTVSASTVDPLFATSPATNTTVTAEDTAWAEHVDPLVGTLPDTGGRGYGGFALAGLLTFLLAGWFMRRNTLEVRR